MKDKDLQLALAKMLPEKIAAPSGGALHWKHRSGSGGFIRPTEWLHVCWLVRSKYELPVLVGSNEPWQEQARHILRHVKAREAILETITG